MLAVRLCVCVCVCVCEVELCGCEMLNVCVTEFVCKCVAYEAMVCAGRAFQLLHLSAAQRD